MYITWSRLGKYPDLLSYRKIENMDISTSHAGLWFLKVDIKVYRSTSRPQLPWEPWVLGCSLALKVQLRGHRYILYPVVASLRCDTFHTQSPCDILFYPLIIT